LFLYMDQNIRRFIGDLQILLSTALTTKSQDGSGLGIFLRTKVKRPSFLQMLGINLAGLAFLGAVVVPQASDVVASLEVTMKTQKNVIVVENVPSVFQWPMKKFGISQYFTSFHPGMDLTNALGTPIYAIGDGVVTWTKYLPVGYGYHVLVTHSDGVKSLYAHLRKISVREGQGVTQMTKIGEMGVTGRSTGSHLHLEVYQNNIPTNPMEVLPALKEL
jgi:murein DD-endopeptidase MepM/ murein hydrolase activator NlpD